MIPEHETLRRDIIHFNYGRKISRKELNISFKKFINSYYDYAKNILKDKVFTEKQIVDCIFKHTFKSGKMYNDMLKKRLYVSTLYLNELEKRINGKNISKHIEFLQALLSDLEYLQAQLDVNYLKVKEAVKPQTWRNHTKDTRSLYQVSQAIWNFESIKSLKDVYIFDLRPTTIFLIRQIIEVYGKRVIGIKEIKQNGGISKKNSQIAWKFIKDEVNKPKPNISLPFNIDTIIKIEEWSNIYVHTTFDDDYFVTWYALNLLHQLFIPAKQGIKEYDGKYYLKYNCAEIIIQNYSRLKNNFEIFIDPKQNQGYSFIWEEPKNLYAYVARL